MENNKDELKVLKVQLEETTDISLRQVARNLHVDASVVSRIFNDSYNGSNGLTSKVIEHVRMLVEIKEDINPLFYGNIDLMKKVFFNAMKSVKFNEHDTETILDIYKKIQSIKNKQ